MVRVLISVIAFLIAAFDGAKAFDRRNLEEAIEMAELSKNMNGDGTADMGTPRDMKDFGRWKLIQEGCDRSSDALGRSYGFKRYGNRWALFQSMKPEEPHTYAIVVRGTIETKASIILDALALATSANAVWFRDNTHEGNGHTIQVADDGNAGVHMGFAAGLVDILFHDGDAGLLGALQKLDDHSVIYITGHSQGAGIATLLHAFLLNRHTTMNQPYGLGKKDFKSRSYVFAQPKPGDWNFAMDFSRSLYRANDGGFAYVINNVWDWVPQSPLSVQWPTELAKGISNSLSASKIAFLNDILDFTRQYIDSQEKFRVGLSVIVNALESQRPSDYKEIERKILERATVWGKEVLMAKLNNKPNPSFLTVFDVVIRDTKSSLSSNYGSFNGDLKKEYFKNLPPLDLPPTFKGDSSYSFTPAGTLISLPLTAQAAAVKDDLTLQHHMALYIVGLNAMRSEIKQ